MSKYIAQIPLDSIDHISIIKGQGRSLAQVKYIPIACGVVGAVVGGLWFYMGWGEYPATEPVTAVAVGIVSGLAATGVNQVFKQISSGKEG